MKFFTTISIYLFIIQITTSQNSSMYELIDIEDYTNNILLDESTDQSVKEDTSIMEYHSLNIEYHINKELESKIEETKNNTTNIVTKSYTILVYSGLNRLKSRRDISIYKERIFDFRNINLTYQQPNYIVKIENYINKLKAFRDYKAIKSIYHLSTMNSRKKIIPIENIYQYEF